MKHLSSLLPLAILFLIFGCSNEMEKSGSEAYLEMVEPEKPISETDTERKLTKEGFVQFETDNLNSARETVIKAVKIHNGYLSSDREFKQGGLIKNEIVLRVPADKFEILLSDATAGVKSFDRKEIVVKDVTEEFLDVEARLKTKKELESRYLILLQKANNVTEILEIEKELGKIRAEIESTEGRLKYLQNRVSYSVLNITFYEDIPNDSAFGKKFKDAFSSGWDNLILFFVMLTHIWPFLLIGVAFIVAFKIFRKRKNKQR